jgi:hypothetical protein
MSAESATLKRYCNAKILAEKSALEIDLTGSVAAKLCRCLLAYRFTLQDMSAIVVIGQYPTPCRTLKLRPTMTSSNQSLITH